MQKINWINQLSALSIAASCLIATGCSTISPSSNTLLLDSTYTPVITKGKDSLITLNPITTEEPKIVYNLHESIEQTQWKLKKEGYTLVGVSIVKDKDAVQSKTLIKKAIKENSSLVLVDLENKYTIENKAGASIEYSSYGYPSKVNRLISTFYEKQTIYFYTK